MKKWIILLLPVVFLVAVSACGDSGEETPAAMTPEQLGKAIADVYVKCMTEVADMTTKKEDAGILKPKLETFREDVIGKLVVLGKKREAMGTTDRAAVDRNISAGMSAIPRDVYGRYNEGYKHYAGVDRETGNLIASFNTITQYANFDLLKKQNPEEAKRLDIK